jgi:hypothetical protein
MNSNSRCFRNYRFPRFLFSHSRSQFRSRLWKEFSVIESSNTWSWVQIFCRTFPRVENLLFNSTVCSIGSMKKLDRLNLSQIVCTQFLSLPLIVPSFRFSFNHLTNFLFPLLRQTHSLWGFIHFHLRDFISFYFQNFSSWSETESVWRRFPTFLRSVWNIQWLTWWTTFQMHSGNCHSVWETFRSS